MVAINYTFKRYLQYQISSIQYQHYEHPRF